MKITSQLFEAFLKCATKCHLRSLGETGSGNEYAGWVRAQDESYQREAARRLQEGVPETERIVAPPITENFKTAKWRLGMDLVAQTSDRSADSHVRESVAGDPDTRGLGGPRSEQLLKSRLHAVERVPSEGRGKAAQFIPIRFIFRNKLTKDDKLLLAFDAFVLSETLGREVNLGKIIHGDDHATLKVRTSALTGEVRKSLEKIAALLSGSGSPDLVLNRHCAECEFQARCRKIAVEKDDLSLLAGMSVKERQKLRSKGIFTVTQLSYTFRPRRRPKRQRDKREKYHHSLKALAIREKKIHIVGSPELKIEGTPVYLDVEGLPDRDFYYLIGVRIGNGESAVQHSLWADSVENEGKIWREFLGILETVEKPVLIHYGSYETDFLKTLNERHGNQLQGQLDIAAKNAVNLLSQLLDEIYFPTFSNGLKDIGTWLGFTWSAASPVGINSMACRDVWERTRDVSMKDRLIAYNVEDCRAAEVVTHALLRLQATDQSEDAEGCPPNDAVYVRSLKPPRKRFGPFKSPVQEFDGITETAWWNYQRDRIYLNSKKRRKRAAPDSDGEKLQPRKKYRPNKVVKLPVPAVCPFCGGGCIPRSYSRRTLQDLHIWPRKRVKAKWLSSASSGLRRTGTSCLHSSISMEFHGTTTMPNTRSRPSRSTGTSCGDLLRRKRFKSIWCF
jgi:predicted RecB family nuclease